MEVEIRFSSVSIERHGNGYKVTTEVNYAAPANCFVFESYKALQEWLKANLAGA